MESETVNERGYKFPVFTGNEWSLLSDSEETRNSFTQDCIYMHSWLQLIQLRTLFS